MKTRLVIADDHPLMRSGIKNIIQTDDTFEIVAEASDGQKAIDCIEEHKPEIVILDISMPVKSGLEVLRHFKGSDYKFIILSNYQEDEYIIEAVQNGAKAYVLKDIEANNIVQVLHTVRMGQTHYSQEIMRVLVNQVTNPIENSTITSKELEVLKLISDGKSSKMIADELFVSTRTIESHRYNIMRKLNVNNSAELIKKSVKLNLI